MSVNYNRARLNKANNNKEYRKLLIKWMYPPYWDDGINFYPMNRKGFKTPNKQIYPQQRREYRTWKYNRKKQWKG